jgi:ligand-binding sensor domain-containing protein
MSQYLRDRWESDNGFPGGAVHAITQTADGYLWIAADKGLVRFDGLTFHLFLPPGVTSGSDLTVRALAADSDGSLWIQLRSARLLRYRQGEFADVTVDPDRKTAFVTAMSHGIDEAMLFALIGHYVIVNRAGRFDTMMPQNVIATPGSFVISIAQTADGETIGNIRAVSRLA